MPAASEAVSSYVEVLRACKRCCEQPEDGSGEGQLGAELELSRLRHTF